MAGYTPAQILKWIPDVDHPALQGLRNGIFGKTTIPVTLYKGDEAVLSADVTLYAHSYSLFAPALAMVLEAMQERGIAADWDAVSFTAPRKKFPRAEVEPDTKGETLAGYMRGYRKMKLEDAIADAGRGVLGASYNDLPLPAQKRLVDDAAIRLCAAVLASDIKVTSPSFDSPKQKRGFFGRLGL